MVTASAVAATLGANVIADIISDGFLHYNYRLDQGIVDKPFGENVESPFWGTRLQHHIGIPIAVTLTEYLSQGIFKKALRTASFKVETHPRAYPLHNVCFIIVGILLYCGLDAALNPEYKGHRTESFTKEIYPTLRGTAASIVPILMFEGTVVRLFSKVTPFVNWAADDLLTDVAVYLTVKGFGWNDYGAWGLTDRERKRNGLTKPPQGCSSFLSVDFVC
ncbi:MAG: hypothetical protein HYW02_03955 [Deltaproteobacteria bacterium]|nr:hypothetical protein [Deltaproteobacteria bacterium]